MTAQDPELSAALGWPGGISDPVLDRTRLLQMVAALRLASQQALEALEDAKALLNNKDRTTTMWFADEITALRAALAQQEQDWKALYDAQVRLTDAAMWRAESAQRMLDAALAQQEQEPEPVAWTDRELELIDGMIEVQLHHAAQCDGIANRTMAEKQKGWDMERVALLRKIKSISPRREWQSLTEDEINAVAAELGYAQLTPREVARAVEQALRSKNHE